jgi:hypothetical protein
MDPLYRRKAEVWPSRLEVQKARDIEIKTHDVQLPTNSDLKALELFSALFSKQRLMDQSQNMVELLTT